MMYLFVETPACRVWICTNINIHKCDPELNYLLVRLMQKSNKNLIMDK